MLCVDAALAMACNIKKMVRNKKMLSTGLKQGCITYSESNIDIGDWEGQVNRLLRYQIPTPCLVVCDSFIIIPQYSNLLMNFFKNKWSHLCK